MQKISDNHYNNKGPCPVKIFINMLLTNVKERKKNSSHKYILSLQLSKQGGDESITFIYVSSLSFYFLQLLIPQLLSHSPDLFSESESEDFKR